MPSDERTADDDDNADGSHDRGDPDPRDAPDEAEPTDGAQSSADTNDSDDGWSSNDSDDGRSSADANNSDDGWSSDQSDDGWSSNERDDELSSREDDNSESGSLEADPASNDTKLDTDVMFERIGAFVLDFTVLSVFVGVIWFVFMLVGLAATAGTSAMAAGSDPASSGLLTASGIVAFLIRMSMWLLIGLVVAGYFILMESRDGQTLGKSLLGIKTVRTNGSAIDRGHANKRTAVLLAPLPVMAVIEAIIPFFGFPLAIGIMGCWLLIEAGAMATGDGQRLGDRYAGTTVINAD